MTDVATVQVSSGRSGTNVNGEVLGGGGSTLSLPLGSTGGVSADLPGLGGLLPGTVGPTGPGNNQPGANGQNGTNNFFLLAGVDPGASAGGGGGANGLALQGTSNSRLRMLASVLQNRAWMRFAQGNRICLPPFAVAQVSAGGNSGAMQKLISAHGGDIATLQQMLRRCNNGQSRAMDVSRVVGVDFNARGQVTVFTL